MEKLKFFYEKGNLIFALILEGVGIWVIIDSYRMGLKTLSDPGAGLFPFLLGFLLCLLALPICIGSLKDIIKVKILVPEKEKGIRYWITLKIIAIIVLLVGYFIFLDILGFSITTFLFMYGLFWIGYPRRWLLILVISAVTVTLSYLIFNTLLKTPFPSGFLNLG